METDGPTPPPAGVGDIDDDEPIFLDPNTAVEVQVADGDEPMSDDEDENADSTAVAGGNPQSNENAEAASAAADSATAVVVPDMSTVTLQCHAGPVYSVSTYLQNGTLQIVSGGGDDRAYLHAVSTNSSPRVNTTVPLSHPHTDSISSTCINAKFIPPSVATAAGGKAAQKLVAVGSYDGNIVLYDMDGKNSEIVKVLDGPTDVEFVDFHPKGGTVLLAGSISDGTVWMYHTPTQKCLQVFVGHECNGEGGGVTAGTFTPDGKFAVSAGMDGTVRIWAPRTGLCRHVFRLVEGGTGGLTCLEVDGGSDGQLAVAGGEDGVAHVVHLGGKKVVVTLRHYDPSPAAAAGGGGGDGMDVDGENKQEEMRSVEAVGFASRQVNPNWVATGGVDGNIKVWDLTQTGGTCRQVCSVPATSAPSSVLAGAGVTRLVWHPTQPVLIASYTDGTVRIWDARDGTMVRELTGGHSDVLINDMSVEFAAAQEQEEGSSRVIITTAADDGAVRVYEIDV